MAHDYIWFLIHNNGYHNESIYLKYQYDKKKQSKVNQKASVIDLTDQAGGVEEQISEENNLAVKEAGNQNVDDVANLCEAQRNNLFCRYELADVVLKHEFGQKKFE